MIWDSGIFLKLRWDIEVCNLMELQTPKDLECMAPWCFFGQMDFFGGCFMDGTFDKLHLEGPEAVDVIMADAQDLFFVKRCFDWLNKNAG